MYQKVKYFIVKHVDIKQLDVPTYNVPGTKIVYREKGRQDACH